MSFLASTKQELAIVIKERDLLREEKELEVSALNTQIEFIQKSYESIIKVNNIYNRLIHKHIDSYILIHIDSYTNT